MLSCGLNVTLIFQRTLADSAFNLLEALRPTLIYQKRQVIPLCGFFGRDLRLVRLRRGLETTSKPENESTQL